jgi:hypothetical protein
VFHVDGRAEAPHVFRHVVAENDVAHRRLARSALPHQKDLLLLRFDPVGVHDGARRCTIPEMDGRGDEESMVVFDGLERVGGRRVVTGRSKLWEQQMTSSLSR